MSTSLIVSIAFFTGLILSYALLKKVVKDILKIRHKKNSKLMCSEKEFNSKVLSLYKSALRDYGTLVKEVKEMESTLKDVYNGVIGENKIKLDKELNEGIAANVKQAAEQIKKAKEELETNIANLAANSVKTIMDKDNKNNSEVISTLSRDLRKKLH